MSQECSDQFIVVELIGDRLRQPPAEFGQFGERVADLVAAQPVARGQRCRVQRGDQEVTARVDIAQPGPEQALVRWVWRRRSRSWSGWDVAPTPAS